MKLAAFSLQIGPILSPKASGMMRVLLFMMICLGVCAPARADIELSPLRHVVDADNRSVVFSLSNPSSRIVNGDVTWTDLNATETGYAPASTALRQVLSAAPYLTVSPAYFRLEPGARIDITIRLKDGVAPPDGERRSHLLVTTNAARTLIRQASNSGLQADMGLGVSVPVLLRGTGEADAKIKNVRLLRDKDGRLVLSAEIAPKGDLSTYGKLVATFQSADRDKSATSQQLLGARANIAGYLDAERRLVEIPLDYYSLGAGELTLRYEGEEEFAGRIFDQHVFSIAPSPRN